MPNVNGSEFRSTWLGLCGSDVSDCLVRRDSLEDPGGRGRSSRDLCVLLLVVLVAEVLVEGISME